MMKKSRFTVFLAFFVVIVGTLSISNPLHAQSWRDKLNQVLGKKGDSEQPVSETTSDKGLGSLLNDEDLIEGFKEALEVSSKRVVAQLGTKNGFNTDESIHIPLPDNLRKARSLLERIGMESVADDLELKLNRAAEAAVPEAKELLINAVKSMSFEDVRSIYKGPNDSATQYFRSKTSESLSNKMRPIIDKSLNEVGAIATYDQFIEGYKTLPLVPDIKSNLNDYVLEKAMDGTFYYLAQEEAAIRENPLKRTTELLKKVFMNE